MCKRVKRYVVNGTAQYIEDRKCNRAYENMKQILTSSEIRTDQHFGFESSGNNVGFFLLAFLDTFRVLMSTYTLRVKLLFESQSVSCGHIMHFSYNHRPCLLLHMQCLTA
jgi:hypothetical protein